MDIISKLVTVMCITSRLQKRRVDNFLSQRKRRFDIISQNLMIQHSTCLSLLSPPVQCTNSLHLQIKCGRCVSLSRHSMVDLVMLACVSSSHFLFMVAFTIRGALSLSLSLSSPLFPTFSDAIQREERRNESSKKSPPGSSPPRRRTVEL